MIFSHHYSELLFELLKPSQPLFIDKRPFDVYGYLYLKWHFYLDSFLHLNWSIYVNRLINKHRFIHDYRIFVNRLIDKHSFFYNLGNFDLLNNYLRYFPLNLDIFRYLNNFLYDSLRSWNIFWNLNFYLYRLFYNKLSDSFFWRNLWTIFCTFFQHFDLRFHLKLFSFEFVNDFFMLSARNITLADMIKL